MLLILVDVFYFVKISQVYLKCLPYLRICLTLSLLI